MEGQRVRYLASGSGILAALYEGSVYICEKIITDKDIVAAVVASDTVIPGGDRIVVQPMAGIAVEFAFIKQNMYISKMVCALYKSIDSMHQEHNSLSSVATTMSEVIASLRNENARLTEENRALHALPPALRVPCTMFCRMYTLFNPATDRLDLYLSTGMSNLCDVDLCRNAPEYRVSLVEFDWAAALNDLQEVNNMEIVRVAPIRCSLGIWMKRVAKVRKIWESKSTFRWAPE